MDKHLKKSNIYQPLLYAFLISIGMAIGFKLSNPQHFFVKKFESTEANAGKTGDVEEVIRFIDSKYVYDVDAAELTEIALSSIIKELDPHSTYLSKEELESVNQQMNGHYNGIGIETIKDGDSLVVVEILENSPAATSELKLLDRIISIDGKSITELDDTNNTNHSTKEGQTTTLTVIRDGEEIKIEITNALVNAESTCMAYMINDSISYVKIKQFNARVYKDFNFALESLEQHKIKHIIVDLRGNPGGYLPQTANILSLFFKEKDKLLVKTIDKNDRVSEYKSTGRQFYPLDKIAVIVDTRSASGSEILAGAIQDWDRGTIVGQTTYGKGLVQEQYDLKNGGALRLTIAKYLTPSGRFIQKPFDEIEADTQDYASLIHERPLANQKGIVPDIKIDIPTNCPTVLSKGLTFTAYKIIRDQEWHKSNSPNEIKQLSFNQLMGFADDDIALKNNSADPCIAELSRKVKFKILSLLHSDAVAFQTLHENDPFIQEAIHSVSTSNLLVKSIQE